MLNKNKYYRMLNFIFFFAVFSFILILISWSSLSETQTYKIFSAKVASVEPIHSIYTNKNGIIKNFYYSNGQELQKNDIILDFDDKTEIKSPISGILQLQSNYTAGNYLPEGTAIGYIIPNGNKFKTIINIPETEIHSIIVGQHVEYIIYSEETNKNVKLDGEIILVSPDSKENYYTVEATLELPDISVINLHLSSSMEIKAKIEQKSEKILFYILDTILLKRK